ncbi:hypothetical protein K227x_36320 [Rubripirellula lacrimiformis]|uniref:DUF1016 domain-containing protein n=1 Tax=Rubripirellula lacrimiformis TaxID=1930273 RepID=A0A517NDM7_9BACT|nr:PDDEXK nuclease domain-containing protein [Rubripirellula lacrimiformis]QDT05233.1 hypothetical protein K227x_36320 [Rubripirellula lacrimiformis]
MAKKKSGVAVPDDYAEVFEALKARVRQSQTKAMLSVNRELIQLYWDIGRQIAQRQQNVGWGRSVVDRLSKDLRSAFPDVSGFSSRNIWRMRAFFQAYSPASENLPQAVAELETLKLPPAVAEIPWSHNTLLIEKVKDPVERHWYAAKTLEHGWSRAVLTVQIESGLYQRQGKAITNFVATLPPPQSDLAQESLKDPYLFDFLTLHEDAVERDLEQGLTDHVQRFLLELGAGFAFVGRQVPISVGDEDDFLDLLFYHLKLRCFVVIDLKMKKFTPADAGQMNYYLSAVDDLMRHPNDEPTIGLILCKSKERIKAEYALRDINKPIGVAEWQTQLVESLPEPLKGSLPSIEEIEAEFESEDSP